MFPLILCFDLGDFESSLGPCIIWCSDLDRSVTPFPPLPILPPTPRVLLSLSSHLISFFSSHLLYLSFFLIQAFSLFYLIPSPSVLVFLATPPKKKIGVIKLRCARRSIFSYLYKYTNIACIARLTVLLLFIRLSIC